VPMLLLKKAQPSAPKKNETKSQIKIWSE